MPRIRTIKPEFFSDEKFAPLPVIDRFVFLGMVSMADDAGRLVDNVKQIDGMIFPSTTDSCRESLATLARLGRIIRYTSASGQELIQITKWKEHQRVDKPAKYVLPGPTSAVVAQAAAAAKDTTDLAGPSRESPGEPREDVARSSRSDLRPTTYDHGPTTNDLRPAERSGKGRAGADRSEPSMFDDPDIAEFGRTFYGTAPRHRIRDVKRQLRATLNGGARVRKGVRVFAGSMERLKAKCREVLAEGMKDPDKAIVVLLAKLGDVGNADDSPTERAAEELKAEVKRDELDLARRLELAAAWLELNPAASIAIDAEVRAEFERNPVVGPFADMLRRTLYRSALLKAWTDAGEPVTAEAHAVAR